MQITRFGFLGYVVEGVEHQQGMGKLFCSFCTQLLVVEQLHHRVDVITAEHGAEQFDGIESAQQRRFGFTFGNGSQESSLHVSGFVDTGGHTVADQVEQKLFLALRRVLQQLHQCGSLFGVQGFGNDAQFGAFGNMFAVGYEHCEYLVEMVESGKKLPCILCQRLVGAVAGAGLNPDGW